MATHKLKTWTNAWEAMNDGRKGFEWRKDDRGYEVGDILELERYDPSRPDHSQPYWPESLLRVEVTYILRGMFDVPPGYCIMSTRKLDA